MATTINEALMESKLKADANLKKYSRNIRIAESVQKKAGKSPLTLEKKITLAQTLANTEARMLNEATNSSNIPSKTYFMDLLTAVVPNIITPDIVSTQPLESKAGMISFLRFTYGTNKGKVTAGQMFNNSLYTGQSDTYYTSRIVDDEPIADGVNLEFVPVLPKTVAITLADGTRLVDDGTGNLVNPATGTTVGTVNYASGAFTTTNPIGDGATATYEYNNEQVPDLQVPEMNMSLGQVGIFAKSRKLAAYWGFDAAYDLKQQYGTEILDVMKTQAAGEIAHKQLVA